MPYCEEFSEVHKVLDHIEPASHAGGLSTNWCDMSTYHRAFVLIECGSIVTTLDVAVWQATDQTGAGAKAVTSKSITQLAGGDDNALVGIELRTEELDVTNGFNWIRVQTDNGGGGGNTYSVVLFGIVTRYAPVGHTEFDEIVH